MKTIIKNILPALIVAGSLNAQVLDGVYGGEKNPSATFEASGKLYVEEMGGYKRPHQQDYIRQANVSWEKRVWRTIDLREKLNQPLMFPLYPTQNRISLLDLIKKGIESGEITIFSDDEFKAPLTKEQALARFYRRITIDSIDSVGTRLGQREVIEE
ncbi:MAG: hypothetical protein IAF38_16625, partial [Bacteroidia bacterium]|nr:hypothetical protein [Bacteroidia bacterium]